MKAGKVWGETKVLLSTPHFQAHELFVYAKSRCSTHRHRTRFNAFYVLDGLLFVEVWQDDYALVDETILQAGDVLTVAAGLYHRFYTKELEARCVEIYYPAPLDAQDIERLDVGGRET